ncbi:MAG: hypothetical protein COW00_17135 [Bdellovibrio sp. CG12_big_fil_rev_8_21_14_0_65_39_13]|nr:MAG: hypothetical protein COW78_00305 [Bdellovibrio sp. CG22_combo_CG10-13_8_21_14_all_39_27]PIQ58160.1 MAG: hypothetical protein COW00_17135 [Bdellovibrio sp. CG12_big_fil_rev_8_21_14_0_65_39_13]PIR34322.1 MAG: hypothetical protein COV37_13375 [Bdellovibrio sp. CG11_big_fil_rev_8_21_14_0_20_39_38]PJB54078.1 MAG: hypothetical protein CO099_03545 [Bdellovibrio sp. CG_4_9_14_3_um_filter_39_7]
MPYFTVTIKTGKIARPEAKRPPEPPRALEEDELNLLNALRPVNLLSWKGCQNQATFRLSRPGRPMTVSVIHTNLIPNVVALFSVI